jgi:hypothetical protein
VITVSEQAKSALWSSLQQSGIPTDRGLRLQPGEEGFTLEIDEPTQEDRVIRHNEAPVLIIDGGLDEQIDDLVIDITEGPQGPQLTIQPAPEPPAVGV